MIVIEFTLPTLALLGGLELELCTGFALILVEISLLLHRFIVLVAGSLSLTVDHLAALVKVIVIVCIYFSPCL